MSPGWRLWRSMATSPGTPMDRPPLRGTPLEPEGKDLPAIEPSGLRGWKRSRGTSLDRKYAGDGDRGLTSPAVKTPPPMPVRAIRQGPAVHLHGNSGILTRLCSRHLVAASVQPGLYASGMGGRTIMLIGPDVSARRCVFTAW